MIDANTVVSAALNPNGTSRRAVAIAREKGTIALSEAVYQEVAAVLARPKFAQVLTDDRRSEILELLAAAALWTEPRDRVEDCRDAKDNRYLERRWLPAQRSSCPATKICWCWTHGAAFASSGLHDF